MPVPQALRLVSDMLTEARLRFAEIAFTTWIPDSDLISWMNLGTYDIVIRAMPPSHEVLNPVSISTIIGTYQYALPDGSVNGIPAFLRVSELEGDQSGVFFNGLGLDHTSRRRQLEDTLANSPSDFADPESFWLWGNTLLVFPIPGVVGTLRMYYYRQPTEVILSTDPIDLDMPWREVLLKFLLWKALEKDKNAMAQVYRTEYEQALSNMYSESRVRIEKRARFVHQPTEGGTNQ